MATKKSIKQPAKRAAANKPKAKSSISSRTGGGKSSLNNKLNKRNIAILTVLVFALVGAFVLLRAKAAVSVLEAESGTKSKEVLVVSDSTASGGKYATFNSASTTTQSSSTQRFPGDPNPLVTGKAYWGAAVGGNDDPYERHEKPTGTSLSIRRTFFGWGSRTTSMVDTAKKDLAANRLPWVSTKTPTSKPADWAKMANGTYDKEIDEMLVALDNLGGSDKPVWLTVWHEPENDNGNAADWRGMQKRIRDRINALKAQGKPMDNIAFAPILMSWTFQTSSGRNMNDWWVDGIWDFFGVDPYCYNTCSSKGKTILTDGAWNSFVSYLSNKNIPIGIGEWGETNKASVWASVMRDVWAYGFQNKKDIVGYAAFDSGLNPPSGDPGVDTTFPPEVLATFQDILKNDQRVQRVNDLKAGSVPASNFGTITAKVNLPESGSYKLWVRTAASNSTNALSVQIDNGQVLSMGGPTTSSDWTWVDFKNGDQANKAVMNLNAGEHTIKITGTNKGVKLDKFLLTNESCIPEGIGGCPVANTPPNTPPTTPSSKYASVKIASPTAGQTIVGNTVVKVDQGTANIQEVSFRVDGKWQATDKETPFEWTWDTTKYSNGNHSIVARVRLVGDAGNVNSGDQIAAAVKVSNTSNPTTPPVQPADTQAPSTPNGLRAALRFDWTKMSYVVDLNWLKSSDNDEVGQYTIKRDGSQLGTTTNTSFTDRKSMSADQVYTYSVSAKDKAGNTSKEGTMSISTKCSFMFCSIQVL